MSLVTRPLELTDLFKSLLTKAVVLDSICGHVWRKAGSLASMCVHVSEHISISGIIIIIMFIGHLTLCQRLCMYYLISFNPYDNIVRRAFFFSFSRWGNQPRLHSCSRAGPDAVGGSNQLPSHLQTHRPPSFEDPTPALCGQQTSVSTIQDVFAEKERFILRHINQMSGISKASNLVQVCYFLKSS